VIRRLHVSRISLGKVELDPAQSHHATRVLRLELNDPVELFDDEGAVAAGVIVSIEPGVTIRVDELREASKRQHHLTVAAAVPKGDRADWMVEKLSELGVDLFIPLEAARSVVLPGGKNKIDRWRRLAVESAKQSRRTGVMEIQELAPLKNALAHATQQGIAWCLSTQPSAQPIMNLLKENLPEKLTVFIGPEGGWTDEELSQFETAGAKHIGLTASILRIETAAVTTAAVIQCAIRAS